MLKACSLICGAILSRWNFSGAVCSGKILGLLEPVLEEDTGTQLLFCLLPGCFKVNRLPTVVYCAAAGPSLQGQITMS